MQEELEKIGLGLIPARGGSKGLPGKNLRPLLGRPLISWSISAAMESGVFEWVIVSTDSTEIAEVARSEGALVPFIRPPSLATDDASAVDVAIHAISEVQNLTGVLPATIALLEPTSPLRSSVDLREMSAKFHAQTHLIDGLISVTRFDHDVSLLRRIDGSTMRPFFPEMSLVERRQDSEPAFVPNGVAYLMKSETLMSERTFYPRRCGWHLVPKLNSIEIDSLEDFKLVESLAVGRA